MKILRNTKEIAQPLPYPVVAIGNFDGVHQGHQTIFRQAVELAKAKNGHSIVLTFEPHPLSVIDPQRLPAMLTTFEKKLALIEASGIDTAICVEFNREFANQSAREFVETVLVKEIGAKEVIVGFHYAFGRGREGSPECLKELGNELGFQTHIVAPVTAGEELVSSSQIRKLVESGDVQKAGRFLCRSYSITGRVAKGFNLGKDLGFPTANIETGNQQIPGRGVYAVEILIDGKEYQGVANIGTNPTFERKQLSIEVHIFDFDQDLYGQEIETLFVEKIRGEVKFPSAEALVKQIRRDIQSAKSILVNSK